jgi:hypothetical protein
MADQHQRLGFAAAATGARARSLLCLAALYPVAVASVGAIAARPIADDYSFLASATDGLIGGFTRWMTEWTGYYSFSWLQNAGAWVSTPGTVNIVFPAMSLALLGLLTWSLRQCVLALNSVRAFELPVWPATAVLTAGALGSLTLLGDPDPGVLFGALYWQSLWLGHLVPLLLLPFALRLLHPRAARTRKANEVLGLLAGFVLAGFAFSLTGIIGAAVVACLMGSVLLHGQRPPARVIRTAGALLAGLTTGTAVAFLMPGTGRRREVLAEQRPHELSVEVFWRSVNDVGYKALVESPSLILGLGTGLLLVWGLGGDSRRRTIDVLAVCSTLVVVAAIISIGVGAAVSYPAWWHLLPLLLITYLAATMLGAALATRWRPAFGAEAIAGLVALIVIAFASMEVHDAAAAAWERQRVFDTNLPLQHGRWTAQPVGEIADLKPGASDWVTQAAAEWLGKQPHELRVRELPILYP